MKEKINLLKIVLGATIGGALAGYFGYEIGRKSLEGDYELRLSLRDATIEVLKQELEEMKGGYYK